MDTDRPSNTQSASNVLDLLLDRKIQKEIKKVNPTFNRAELIAAILEEWGGQNNFAKDIYLEFKNAPRGSAGKTSILNKVMTIICDESNQKETRDVDDMTEEELNKAIIAISPGLKAYTKGNSDGVK